VQPNRTAVRNGLLVGGAFFVLTGVVTGLVPTPIFDRMVPRTPLDYAFLLLTTVLAGTYAAQRTMRSDCSGDACGYVGAAGGFFAVACPHCNAILVAVFGASWLATYVDPIRPLFGFGAVALLGGIVYTRRSTGG
jgi:hypothetical protein